jgi:hypothetical protein
MNLKTALVKATVGLPKYLLEYFGGLVVATFTIIDMTTLTIFAIAVGFVTSVGIGVASFFGLYLVMRVISSIADAIGIGLKRHGEMTAPPRPAPYKSPPQTNIPFHTHPDDMAPEPGTLIDPESSFTI